MASFNLRSNYRLTGEGLLLACPGLLSLIIEAIVTRLTYA